ncbi:MAG: manganese efflux pump MntP family protein [bacterium]|nr:manganese efflux pump MntP family protein [bacterium]
MDPLSLFALAMALAMDACAVALAAGVSIRPLTFRPCFRLSFHFGLFQALMPIIGWMVGLSLRSFVHNVSHWVAFALLAAIGGHMIVEALRPDNGEKNKVDPSRGLTMVGLSLATSIDALAVGLSLAILRVEIWWPALVIGAVAGLMTLLGLFLGNRAGLAWGSRVEVVGGLVLISIGTKILLSGLHII